MLKKSFTRLNKKASSGRRSRQSRPLKILALGLMSLLTVGVSFGLWSNTFAIRKPRAAVAASMVQPPPAIPAANNPSKEYIYAGSRLIATEEPANNLLPTVNITAPTSNFTFAAGSNLTVTVNASDADGSITQVQILQNGTPLGLATAAGGGVYNFTWTNVAAGAYSLTAKATDNSGGVATSTPVPVTSNSAPTISITGPAPGAVFTAPASITIDASANDADGVVSQVEFYQGSTLIGTDNTSPYSVTWTNVAAGTYSLTAKATDNNGAATTSGSVSVTVNTPANVLPTASLTGPANGAVFTAPATITISATAADSDGNVSRVDFYQGATLIGSDTSSPYSIVWSNVAANSYSLTAKAIDNLGAVGTSPAVGITVNPNGIPTVSVSGPANGAVFTAPANITVTANANDADGSVTKVDFYQGSTLIGTDSTSPYSIAWNSVGVGTYSLTAQATDNLGAVGTSAVVSITVNPNGVPTVNVSGPANGAVFIAPANITVTANANDADGSVTKVDFYQGATLIGTDSTSPYSIPWNNVGVGTYSLTAKATDNLGAVGTSAPVSITVNPNSIPTVSVSGPANGAVFTAPANITVTANANDADGSVTKVDFYQGSTLIGTDSTSPYSVAWNGVGFGTYSLTAKATDNLGAVGTSAAINITVNAPPAVSITSPANNAMFAPPANITIAANASDTDGTITKVEFYQGTVLIGTDTTSPYSVPWNSVTSGSYVLTAQATDNRGAVVTSAPVAVTTPTFFDDFNDNSLDLAKWGLYSPPSPAVVSEQNQQLRITLPPSTATYNGVVSNASYDMRGGTAQVELVQAPSQAGWVDTSMLVQRDDQNFYQIGGGAGSIVFRSRISGVESQAVINFDPVAHRFWRIRHNQVSGWVDLETSADGVSWITRKTVTGGFSLLGVKFVLNAGAWGPNNPSPGAAIYNDFQFIAGTCVPATTLMISEFRLRGPNSSNDEYVELYNNSDQSITVCTADGSSGWALVSSDGITRFVLAAGTVIPARSHYLATGAGFSLGAYATGNIAMSVDVPDNTGLALFSSANPANFTLANRLDAVGFTTSGTLYREGAGLAVLSATAGEFSFLRKLNSEIPQDTGDNVADFTFVATNAALYGGTQSILGAPGPENLLSPLLKSTTLPVTVIDPAVGPTVAPNRVRDTAAIGPNAAAGTLSIRRTVTNNTGSNLTRLRFRIIDITTLNSPGYTPGGAQADMRVLSSSDFTATLTSGQQLLVRGTTLESPPTQSLGGGLNSTLAVGVISLSQPLAPGQSISFQWLLGVQQPGSFRFFVSVEAQ